MHTIAAPWLWLLAPADSLTRSAPAYGGDAIHQNAAYSATRIAITPTAPTLNEPLVV